MVNILHTHVNRIFQTHMKTPLTRQIAFCLSPGNFDFYKDRSEIWHCTLSLGHLPISQRSHMAIPRNAASYERKSKKTSLRKSTVITLSSQLGRKMVVGISVSIIPT
ncbi:hypothetical protein AVEN_103038-1 [Araneus ventricosus]|uniref:Uncharacterized protein n=1 Tax=Araneus ventricosus TaxID=182803 RepID=A0A4Y2BAT8_ARAVE|nr:hypothetical protein AVEN_103038-1 [Araneus ventricosus]